MTRWLKTFSPAWTLLVVLGHGVPARAQYSLFEKSASFTTDSLQTVYSLRDSFLVSRSEIALANTDTLLRGRDYEIDYLTGQIRFLKRPPSQTLIQIHYRRFPFELRREYFRRRVVYESLPGDSQSNPATRRIEAKPTSGSSSAGLDFGSSLQKNGSIVRGLTLGTNQSLKMDSGLRLQLSGKVTEGVEVLAALTDQNTPIQPEGNTQTLQEIDKVFVQVKSPHAQATLGDYQLEFTGPEFARYARKLQGAMAQTQIGPTEIMLSGAVSRGEFATNQFLGREGNQGPYQLRGNRGESNIIVLAGTERVWIDGELMTRGENNDYVIEYGNGQITFTRRRLITSDSRITVDFQYSAERFRRNLYSARATSALLGDRLKIGTTFIREVDDKNNPIDLALTPEQLARLQQAGDRSDTAYVTSAKYVGEKKGSYVQVDSAGVRVFRYVGPNQGDWNVTFSYVGQGKGDYRSKSFSEAIAGIFEYVGRGRGDYQPIVLLPLAASHELVGTDLEFSPASSLQLKTEIASTRYDANTYSPLNDEDNRGLAYQIGFGWKPKETKLGAVELSGRYRSINDRFRDIDRTTEVEYNRRWDLTSSLHRGERVQELRGSYRPFRVWTLQGGYGRIEKALDFRSRRWDFQTSLQAKSLPQVDYQVEFIRSDNRSEQRTGDWLRQRGGASYQWWKLRPFFRYLGENKKNAAMDSLRQQIDPGFRYDDFSTGLELVDWKKMTAVVDVGLRDDRAFKSGRFVPRSRATTQHFRWGLNNVGTLNASMEYTHRRRDFTEAAEESRRADLAEVRFSYAPFRRALVTDFNYQISNTQVAKREEVYIKVGEGQGNYRYDPSLNEYVQDPFGDFIRRTVATEDFIPVVELRTSSRLRFEPKRLLNFSGGNAPTWKRVASALSSETFVRIEERTRKQDVWSIYLLKLSRFQRKDVTVFGDIQWRQDLYVLENQRKFNLRLRLQRGDNLNNQFLEGGQGRIQEERSLRLISQLSPQVGTQVEFINKRDARRFDIPGRLDREIRANEVSLDLSYRPWPPLEVAAKTKASLEKDVVPDPDTDAQTFSLMPRVLYSFQGKGRLRGELDMTRVIVSPEDRPIPFEIASGNRPGTSWRWTLNFDYRLSSNMMASLNYSGRSEPGRLGAIHVMRAEMRAFF